MTADQRIFHKEQILLWEEKNLKNLESKELVELYANAFNAMEKRCLATLSTVTVQVVKERILHISFEKFPLLSSVKLEATQLNFKILIQNCENYNIEELKDALRFLLVEFLSVIGNITSGVLSEALYKQLFDITAPIQKHLKEVTSGNIDSLKKQGGKG